MPTKNRVTNFCAIALPDHLGAKGEELADRRPGCRGPLSRHRFLATVFSPPWRDGGRVREEPSGEGSKERFGSGPIDTTAARCAGSTSTGPAAWESGDYGRTTSSSPAVSDELRNLLRVFLARKIANCDVAICHLMRFNACVAICCTLENEHGCRQSARRPAQLPSPCRSENDD